MVLELTKWSLTLSTIISVSCSMTMHLNPTHIIYICTSLQQEMPDGIVDKTFNHVGQPHLLTMCTFSQKQWNHSYVFTMY